MPAKWLRVPSSLTALAGVGVENQADPRTQPREGEDPSPHEEPNKKSHGNEGTKGESVCMHTRAHIHKDTQTHAHPPRAEPGQNPAKRERD